jgi:hypothetical protein
MVPGTNPVSRDFQRNKRHSQNRIFGNGAQDSDISSSVYFKEQKSLFSSKIKKRKR